MTSHRLRFIILIGLIAAIVLGTLLYLPVSTNSVGTVDLLPYWSAAYLLARGGNPYDRAQLTPVYLLADVNRENSDPAWNPPSLLFVLMPLALLPFPVAVPVWLLFNISMFGLLPFVIWRSLVGRKDLPAPVWLPVLGLGWMASLAAIGIGQVVAIVLLGVVMCVVWLSEGHTGRAGAALSLTVAKPQLVFLIVPVILIWAASHRQWRVWWGLGLALLLSFGVVTLLRPDWITSYFGFVGSRGFIQHLSPTFGGAAQAYLDIRVFNYAGVFAFLAVPWLVRLIDRRDVWTAVNAAVLITLPLTPYDFTFDHVILLPVIIQIVLWLRTSVGPAPRRILLAGLLAVIYLLALGLKVARVGDVVFVWVPLILAGLYVLTLRTGLLSTPVTRTSSS